MEPQQQDTEAVVTSEDVTVRQSYAEERFDLPTVVIELDSDWELSVTVRLVVDLPAELDITEVGFHPNFRRDNWTVENDRLIFEAAVPPDRTITTMYAVETLSPAQLDVLLANLHVDRVSVAPGASGQSRDAADIGGTDRQSEGIADTEARATATEESPTIDEAESDDEDHESESDTDDGTTATVEASSVVSEQESEPSAVTAEETVEHGGEATALSGYSAMDLVVELVARLSESDSRTHDDRIQSMKQEGTDESLVETDTRVADLQQRMSDLEALLKPLQGLPQHDPVETLEELDARLETLTGNFETVDERVDEMDERVDERVADVEPQIDAFEEELTALGSDVDERIGDVDSRVDTVAADVERIEGTVESVTDEVQTLAATVEGVADDLEALRNQVATIESDQEALTSEVSRLSEWRSNVKNVLKTLGK